MSEEIVMTRDSNKIPWGFRLTGGRDFSSPFTVVRITGQSVAESKGLRVGDIITEISGQKTTNLNHNEAQQCIVDAGNYLKLLVLRGSSPSIPPAITPVRGLTPNFLPSNSDRKQTTSVVSSESVYSLYEDDSFELLDQSDDEYAEYQEPTEQDIERMLLENAEVIEENGKNVLGVNFRRFIPKCEFIKDSAVFQVLQEEQVHKEIPETEQLLKCPDKRFSTFLSQPDRPIPKPKPRRLQEQENNQTNDESNCNEEEGSTVSENELEKTKTTPDTTDTPAVEKTAEEFQDQNEQVTDVENEVQNLDADEEHTETDVSNTEIPEEENKCSSEFDEQLKSIKKTLEALEQLPSLIQTQITTIQSQLNNLLTSKDQSSHLSNKMNDILEEAQQPEETEQENTEDTEQGNTEETDPEEEANTQEEEEPNTTPEETEELVDKEGEEQENNVEQNEENEQNEDNTVKRRPHFPLTPLPRPVVLPGGRIWRKPKDAYNEKFIAETLIAQAEVLVGSTLGVNFRKYEPPKFDLSNSAVYKLVHNIESKKTGLEDRDTIPSLQDYYQSPISARHFYCAYLASKNKEVEKDNTES